jgi:hypothetical protein
MKALGKVEIECSPFLTSTLDGDGWLAALVDRVFPEEGAPVPIENAVWAPEPVWTLWRRGRSLASVDNRTPSLQPATPTDPCFTG